MDYIQDRTVWPKIENYGSLKEYAKVIKKYLRISNLKHTEYHSIWKRMQSRCYASSHKEYPLFGGKGTKMSDDWDKHWLFMFSDMGPLPTDEKGPDGKSIWDIALINKNSNYLAGNCIWFIKLIETMTEVDVYIEFQGVSLLASEWCAILGYHSVDYNTMCSRVKAELPSREVLKPDDRLLMINLGTRPDIIVISNNNISPKIYWDIIDYASQTSILLSTIISNLNDPHSNVKYLSKYLKYLGENTSDRYCLERVNGYK